MARPGTATKQILFAADRFADVLHAQATDENCWDEVRLAGGIDQLVALLRLGPCRATTQAAAALTHLAHSATNRDAIREAGGISHLIKLLAAPARSLFCDLAGRAVVGRAHDAENILLGLH